MMPIDMADALAKEHDMLQNIPNHKGFMHKDYLNSDLVFLRRLIIFRDKYEKDKNYIDPFTERKVSSEQKDFVDNAITLFKFFLAFKVEALKKDLKDGKLTQSEFDSKMYLFNNQNEIDRVPLPAPDRVPNKGSY